uniref:mediator of RNA polymerase II transcription subunit 25-like n=1 Tax=Erigeron canadensis TaxID=72917 RepID=UPI001CB9D40E|nr:mediator of RNA polymerase II transcription subunit 25-like [Erigeron canadensis]
MGGRLIQSKKRPTCLDYQITGFRDSTASELLAEDWPSTMLIENVTSQDLVISEQSMKKQDILVFQANSLHALFGKLKKLNFCAIAWLPSQTLLLAVSDIQSQLIGMLFPNGTLVLESENSE